MQFIVNVPDLLPKDKILQFIKKVEDFFSKEGITVEVKSEEIIYDPWDNLNINEIAVDTGIEDFAENHDHYLYGISKRL